MAWGPIEQLAPITTRRRNSGVRAVAPRTLRLFADHRAGEHFDPVADLDSATNYDIRMDDDVVPDPAPRRITANSAMVTFAPMSSVSTIADDEAKVPPSIAAVTRKALWMDAIMAPTGHECIPTRAAFTGNHNANWTSDGLTGTWVPSGQVARNRISGGRCRNREGAHSRSGCCCIRLRG